MILTNVHRSGPAQMFLLTGLLAIGLIPITATPVSAPVSGTWTTTGSLNTPRGAHTATLLQSGDVLVVGGQDNAGNILASAELYDPATGKWTVTGSMATPRVGHTTTLLPDGEVLVAGGYHQGIYTATAEVYNPSTFQWRATGSMTMPRAYHGATLLDNEEVLVAGGDSTDGSPHNTAEIYNPSAGTWKATGSMNNRRAAALTLLRDGQALIADETAEFYDPSSGKWTLTAPMYYTFGTSRLATVLLSSGDVLVYGNHFACYASEFYNPEVNTWSRAMGQCGTSISYGPLALLDSGKVLLAGGFVIYSGKSVPSANSSLYDPSTNNWAPTGKLKQAGTHNLTLLLNGQVLAVGGSDAELYAP